MRRGGGARPRGAGARARLGGGARRDRHLAAGQALAVPRPPGAAARRARPPRAPPAACSSPGSTRASASAARSWGPGARAVAGRGGRAGGRRGHHRLAGRVPPRLAPSSAPSRQGARHRERSGLSGGGRSRRGGAPATRWAGRHCRGRPIVVAAQSRGPRHTRGVGRGGGVRETAQPLKGGPLPPVLNWRVAFLRRRREALSSWPASDLP